MRASTLSLPVVVGSILLSLPGCGVAYMAERDRILQAGNDADFKIQPPADREEQERRFILSVLKDPESARLAFLGLEKDAIPAEYASPKAVPVWVSRVSVNAKNSFGGYTGSKVWRIAWQNGKILAYSVKESGFEFRHIRKADLPPG